MCGRPAVLEIGRGGVSSSVEFAKIEELAKGLVEKSDGSMSEAQAIDRVLKTREGAELYASYMAAYYRERAS